MYVDSHSTGFVKYASHGLYKVLWVPLRKDVEYFSDIFVYVRFSWKKKSLAQLLSIFQLCSGEYLCTVQLMYFLRTNYTESM